MGQYKKVARTTDDVENAMLTLNRVLEQNFNHGPVLWQHREIGTTKTQTGKRYGNNFGYCNSIRKRVAIKGKLRTGWKISALVMLEGSEHFVRSAFDPNDDVDHSKPITIDRITVELLSPNSDVTAKKEVVPLSNGTFRVV